MAIATGSLHEAQVEGAASSDVARKAAGEAADYQEQLSDVRTNSTRVKTLLGVIVAGVAVLVIRTVLG